jgi:hypothetical protein
MNLMTNMTYKLMYITNNYALYNKNRYYIDNKYLQCIYLLIFVIIILYTNKNIDK